MLQRFQDDDGFVGYRSPLLASLGLPHVFTTRLPGRGRHELERIALAAGLAAATVVTVSQVHGARVIRVGEALPVPAEEADALVSERADVLIGVHTADCVPVLLARSDGRRVAAVHAGWRGLVAGVLPRALAELGGGPFVAAIGPCLSRERFEVGPEVVTAFERAELAAAIHARPGARAQIDLRAAAALQLTNGGVELLDSTDRCTYEHGEEFFSHRRDVTHGGRDRTGRLTALIAAAPERRGRPSG